MVTAVTWSLVAIPRRSRIRVLGLARCYLAWWLAMSMLPLAAAPEQYEGKTVGAIRFDPEHQPLTYFQLTSILAVKAGEPLRSADIRDSIQRLYGTGEYTDIAVDATLENGNVVLRFITKAAYFIGNVTAQGVKEPPNRGQVVTAAKLELGAEFSPTDVQQSVESIGELLKRNGFFNPEITSQTATREDVQETEINFNIEPGRRAKFGGLEITGKPERSTAAIIGSTGWKGFFGLLPWRQVTYNRIQQGLDGVRSWYIKHDFLKSTITLAAFPYNAETNRVVPTLDIIPGPKIEVDVAGAKISKARLRSLLPIYQERTVDDDLLRESNRDLINYFQSVGYFEADSSYKVTGNPSGDERIDFTVATGGRHKLVLLDITGNNYFSTATLRDRMLLTPVSFLRFHEGRYSREYRDRDINAILDVYHANGFPDVQVTSRQVDDYNGKKDQLAVFFDIREGAQQFVSALRFSGISAADEKHLRAVLNSTEGQPYSDSNVATDRDTILQYYYDRGYPGATFGFTSKPGTAPNQVELDFLVTPGRRVYVRRVVVNGLHTTKPSVVSKRISIKDGDPLSQTQITESQRRLYDLGIFASVDTAIQNPEGDEPSKDLIYAIEEANRYSLTYGFGAEIARIGGGTLSLDRPAGATGFSPRVTLGISRLNFLGLGHTVSLQTLVSTLEQRALLTYLIPQFENNVKLNLQFSALFDISRDVRTFSAQREEGAVQLGQRLSKANSMQYRFVFRKVNILGTPLVTPELIPLLSQPVRVGLISSTFIQDRRDDPIDAHRGVYNTIDVGVAAKEFGSQTGFVRLVARNATYHSVTKNIVFARSTYFGDITRYSGLQDIPLAERFFSGGSSSQRAFPDLQAGPRDPVTGFPIGGTALFINNLELRFPLIGENIGGVLFNDMGNVYSSLDKISLRWRQRNLQDFDYGVQSFGFGIRYRTPIGPIRVDLSLSPNSPRFFGYSGTYQQLIFGTGTPVTQRINIFQFHFSLGQQF